MSIKKLTEEETKKIHLFALSSSKKLAKEISELIGLRLGKCLVKRFADGEIDINIEETVRGEHVFVVQSTSTPVNDSYMELLIMVDALKRASAKSITLVMPYYGYSRQDRKSKSRQPITAKLVADLIQISGADRVICLDLHAAQIQGFFNIPIDNFLGRPTIATYFAAKISSGELDDVMVVSPDHGGATRARNLANDLDVPMAIIDKRRPEANKVEVMNIIGNVEGKTCIIIDDMIDTGGTIAKGAEALLKFGAKRVFVAATHGLLSGNAPKTLQESGIEEVVITNSIELSNDKEFDKLKVLSIAEVFSRGILRIIRNEPISSLFEFKK